MKINNLFTILLLTCVFQAANGVNSDDDTASIASTTEGTIQSAPIENAPSIVINHNEVHHSNEQGANFKMPDIKVSLSTQTVTNIINYIDKGITAFSNLHGASHVVKDDLKELKTELTKTVVGVTGNWKESNIIRLYVFGRPVYAEKCIEDRQGYYMYNEIDKDVSKIFNIMIYDSNLRPHASDFQVFMSKFNKNLAELNRLSIGLEQFNTHDKVNAVLATLFCVGVCLGIGLSIFTSIANCTIK